MSTNDEAGSGAGETTSVGHADMVANANIVQQADHVDNIEHVTIDQPPQTKDQRVGSIFDAAARVLLLLTVLLAVLISFYYARLRSQERVRADHQLEGLREQIAKADADTAARTECGRRYDIRAENLFRVRAIDTDRLVVIISTVPPGDERTASVTSIIATLQTDIDAYLQAANERDAYNRVQPTVLPCPIPAN